MEIRDREELKAYLSSTKYDTTILKLTATWCKPCQATKPILKKLNDFYTANHVNYEFIELDVDESMDLYAFLKKMKMANGVPTFLVYKKSMYSPDTYYVPFAGISGADENGIVQLFKKSLEK
jgi:thiol-disulfide isomerase/thioredoxin